MSTNLASRFTPLDILELRSMHITLDPEPFPILDAERWVALREENDRLTTMLLEERTHTEQLTRAYERLEEECAAAHRARRATHPLRSVAFAVFAVVMFFVALWGWMR